MNFKQSFNMVSFSQQERNSNNSDKFFIFSFLSYKAEKGESLIYFQLSSPD